MDLTIHACLEDFHDITTPSNLKTCPLISNPQCQISNWYHSAFQMLSDNQYSVGHSPRCTLNI
jgi:hypothetical protein